MYSKEYEFRYSDLAPDMSIKLSSLIDVFQDVSACHSESCGYSLERMYGMNVAWLLQGWRIEIIKKPEYGKITASTAIMRTRHFEGQRCYEIIQDGEVKVKATASWFTVDTKALKPIIIPEEIVEAYKPAVPDNGLDFVKLRPKEDLEFFKEFYPTFRDTDLNKHVNNMRSAEMLFECVPTGRKVSDFSITYRKAILPEEKLKAFGSATENGIFAELRNENNETCVIFSAILK